MAAPEAFTPPPEETLLRKKASLLQIKSKKPPKATKHKSLAPQPSIHPTPAYYEAMLPLIHQKSDDIVPMFGRRESLKLPQVKTSIHDELNRRILTNTVSNQGLYKIRGRVPDPQIRKESATKRRIPDKVERKNPVHSPLIVDMRV